MTNVQNKQAKQRLATIRDLRDIIADFEDETNESTRNQLRKARHNLEKAGDNINDPNVFDRFVDAAAAQAAGIAIGRGYDEYADRVFEVTDLDPDDVDD